MSSPTRRTLLKGAVASAALGVATTVKANANERLGVALIGCGGRGPGVAEEFHKMPDAQIVAVCDPDEARAGNAAKRFGVASTRTVSDLRRVLDDKSVDAVIIATPDHWHAPAAILACQAGKHVYVEKPCAHNFHEGRLLVEAARRHQRVVQHGTQQRSNPFTATGVQLLREGIIGDVLVAKVWNVQRRNNIGHAKPSPVPSRFDYDTWIGPAPMVPFQKNRHHYTWHWWHALGTGDMGNDGVHDIDYARWGLGVEQHPTRIAAIGGKYFHDDDQQFPDTQTAVFEYPGDGKVGNRRQLIWEMRLWSTNYPRGVDSGVEFYGTKGTMFLSKRGKIDILAERNKRIEVPKPKGDLPLAVPHHQRDFVDAIKTDRLPNADIEIGFHSAALCHFGNMATRLGRSLEFNADTNQMVGDAEATTLLGREYRDGGHWAVPRGV